MNNNFISHLKELLQNKKNISIISHHNPDGDAIGSSLALYHYFKKKAYNVSVVLPNDYPEFLDWMITDETLLVYSQKNKNQISDIIQNSDLIFCVDFNALKRTHILENFIRESPAIKILIDHHLEPEIEAFDICYSKIETSSTAELIYEIIDKLGDLKTVDRKIAECIYVGMITDTGSLSYSCNYVSTYLIMAKLVKLGVDCAMVQRLVYSNFTENRMRLFGICLSKNLFVLPQYKTAYIALNIEDLKKYSYKPGDTEGIVNYAMAIRGIEFAALFVERKDLIRISFRSFGNLSVNHIAKTYFEGGGHKNAAGANSYLPLDNTIKRFLEILPQLDKFY